LKLFGAATVGVIDFQESTLLEVIERPAPGLRFSYVSSATSPSRRPGAPKRNRNAFKHSRYSAEAMSGRREVAALIRDARSGPRYRGGEVRQRKADPCEAA
jgi:hypothetical protein